jgi:hypothetical protein
MRRSTRSKATSATRNNLSGKWRIMEMDLWAREAIDLVGPAFIEFKDEGGQFRFIAVDGWMDCRHGQRNGRPSVDITWDGHDEGDPVSGRGLGASPARRLPDRSHLLSPRRRFELHGRALRGRQGAHREVEAEEQAAPSMKKLLVA